MFNTIGTERSRAFLSNYIGTLILIMKNKFGDLSEVTFNLESDRYNLDESYNAVRFYQKNKDKVVNIIFN